MPAWEDGIPWWSLSCIRLGRFRTCDACLESPCHRWLVRRGTRRPGSPTKGGRTPAALRVRLPAFKRTSCAKRSHSCALSTPRTRRAQAARRGHARGPGLPPLEQRRDRWDRPISLQVEWWAEGEARLPNAAERSKRGADLFRGVLEGSPPTGPAPCQPQGKRPPTPHAGWRLVGLPSQCPASRPARGDGAFAGHSHAMAEHRVRRLTPGGEAATRHPKQRDRPPPWGGRPLGSARMSPEQ